LIGGVRVVVRRALCHATHGGRVAEVEGRRAKRQALSGRSVSVVWGGAHRAEKHAKSSQGGVVEAVVIRRGGTLRHAVHCRVIRIEARGTDRGALISRLIQKGRQGDGADRHTSSRDSFSDQRIRAIECRQTHPCWRISKQPSGTAFLTCACIIIRVVVRHLAASGQAQPACIVRIHIASLIAHTHAESSTIVAVVSTRAVQTTCSVYILSEVA
jgi:hypothetical protein